MVLIAWLGAALAQDCTVGELPEPPDTVSVAWVSRLPKRARSGSWLHVVPTTELRAFAQQHGSVARMLQRAGLRRSGKEPKRRYKVVVFDVPAGALCRPVASAAEGEAVSGGLACDERRSDPSRQSPGCGRTADRADGSPGLVLYRARWSDLARNGFCVLPAERFVSK